MSVTIPSAATPVNSPASHFVTVDYVAALLHADRRTVCNWLTSGRLPGTRPGGTRWLIAREDLNAFLEAASNRRTSPADVASVPSDLQPLPPSPSVSPLANRKNKRRS